MGTIPRSVMATLALALTAVLVVGVWFYRVQEREFRGRVESELASIARLKADQIAAWRAERLDEGAEVMERLQLVRRLTRWLTDPRPGDRDAILEEFRILQRHDDYADVLLVDSEGQVRLGLRGGIRSRVGFVQSIAEAIQAGTPLLTELHVGPVDPSPHISVIAPLPSVGGAAARPLGAVILVNDARKFLYPLVQSWPVPSESAETLLVRRDGDQVLFLNDLRHRKDTALKLRIPLSRADIPAVMAVLGKEGVVRGADYQGQDVLSVLRAIPDSSWFVVAKVDAAEALAGWQTRAALILGLLLGLVGFVGAVGLMVWQRNEKAHYLALYHSEAARRQSEAHHRVTLQSIGDGVIVTDAAGRVKMLNPVAESLTGWPAAEASGRPLGEVFRIVTEGTRLPVEDPVARVLREGTVVGLANHTLLIARDGTERPIADSGAPIRESAGGQTGEPDRVDGVVLVFRDQTEERAAEARLELGRRELQAVLDFLPVMVCVIDADRRVLSGNRAFREASGWPDAAPDDRACGVLGCIRALDDPRGCGFGPRCETCALRLAIADTFATGATHHGIEYSTTFRQCNQQREVALLGAVSPLPSAEAPQVLLSLVDITARKQMEKLVAARARQEVALAELGQAALASHDMQEILEKAVRCVAEILEVELCKVLELLPDRSALLLRAGVGWRDGHVGRTTVGVGVESQAGYTLQSKEPVIVEDLRMEQRFQGPELLIAHGVVSGCSLLVGDAERPYGVFGVHTIRLRRFTADEVRFLQAMVSQLANVISRKQAEAERERLAAQLLQAQKMEAVGRLAGGIAHDFNNLLMGILNYTELVEAALPADAAVRPYLAEIRTDAERSAALIRQLLAFARKQVVAPKRLDLNDTVAGTLKLLRRLIGEDLDLVWRPGPALGAVTIDPSQLDQLLVNLVLNARDALTGPGTITLETTAAPAPPLPGLAPGPYVCLAVSDTGAGMDAATQAHLFEPYFTTKAVGQGTGLGLATVYGIVQQNGGHLSVYSELGRGTTLKVYLPQAAGPGAPAPPPAPPAAAPPRGRGETILVVEDERSIRTTCGLFLQELGYTVLTAATPAEALARLQTHAGPLHLLLTDVVLPGMTGRDLATQLTAASPGLKVCYMSGYTANVIAHQGVLDAGVHFLAKPFTRAELAATVRGVLDETGG